MTMNCLTSSMTVNVSLCGAMPRAAFRTPVSTDHKLVASTPASKIDASASGLNQDSTPAPISVDASCKSLGNSSPRNSTLTLNSELISKHDRGSSDMLAGETSGPTFGLSNTMKTQTVATDPLTTQITTKQFCETGLMLSVPATSVGNNTNQAASKMHPVQVSVPSWAVPASGYSRLEPICDGDSFYEGVDLTRQAVFTVGRSPSNNISLLHRTSSRQHAMVFHHPSGACYLYDCNSAHGTYVNGNRVSKTPTRVRRGSLVRFGGPGAPCFILKCFSTEFGRLLQDLDGVASAFDANKSSAPALQQQANETGVACIKGDGSMACVVDGSDAPIAALVLLNTRLNATGGISNLEVHLQSDALEAKSNYSQRRTKKRSREAEVSLSSLKRQCTTKSILQKSFLQDTGALVTPSASAEFTTGNTRKVSFSDEKPESFYPAAVTPDELSSDSEVDEDEHIVLMKPVAMVN